VTGLDEIRERWANFDLRAVGISGTFAEVDTLRGAPEDVAALLAEVKRLRAQAESADLLGKHAGLLKEVGDELTRAEGKFGPMASPHEGCAVIAEELDELWDEVKADATRGRMREEALQVGAMALRFVVDLCSTGRTGSGDESAVAAAKDEVYEERDRCVAFIVRLAQRLGYEVWLGQHDLSDKDWDPEWRNIVFVQLPTGQLSWHVHASELRLFDGIQLRLDGGHAWDGHTTEEKYQRMEKYR
jgi:hypothetical protein